MKLSIIVPVYNNEQYILKCLNSIQKIKYEDLEVVIIDDGSKDQSGKICDDFCKSDSRFSVYHQENAGVSVARNLGLSKVSGDYVTFIDGDDYIDSSVYEKIIILIKESGADFISTGYYDVEENNISCSYPIKEKQILDCNGENLKYFFEPYNCIIFGVVTKFIRREVLQGLKFDSKIKISEDLKFSVEVYDNSKTAVLSELNGYYYFHHGNSAMTSRFSEKNFEILAVNDWILNNHYYEPIITLLNTRKIKEAVIFFYLMVRDDYQNDEAKKMVLQINREIKSHRWIGLKNEICSVLMKICPGLLERMIRRYVKVLNKGVRG